MTVSKIFVQNGKGELKETTLKGLIATSFENCKNDEIETSVDGFTDGSGTWINIDKEFETKKMTVCVSFDDSGQILEDISVFKTPIKKVVDDENCKKIM